jgi:hypothetical protein
MVKNQAGASLKFFRTNHCKRIHWYVAFFEEHDIVHESTTAYSSSSNGIAERLN